MTEPKLDQVEPAAQPPGWVDIPPRRRSRWTFLVPGTRLRLGAGAVTLLVGVVAVLVLSVLVFPDWLVSKPQGLDQLEEVKDRVAAENDLEQTRNAVRTTLVQAIGGALVLLTFAIGLGQLLTARKGQIIDRFTKAVEQLGSDKTDVRLGGIYALEQITANREYVRPIGEIFAAYLKTHSNEGSSEDDASQWLGRAARKYVTGEETTNTKSGRHEPPRLRPDLQAVLRILIAEGLWNRATLDPLDLSDIAVPHADLRRAHLRDAVLLRARLPEANFTGAELSGSPDGGIDLRNADLSGARLRGATLTRVYLNGAGLEGADLRQTKLNDVRLVDARLDSARFHNAYLSNVDATGARLADAKFNSATLDERTRFVDANLSRADFSGATLVGTQLMKANCTEADFTRAHLDAVDVAGATFDNAIGLETATIDEATRNQIDELLSRSSLPGTRLLPQRDTEPADEDA